MARSGASLLEAGRKLGVRRRLLGRSPLCPSGNDPYPDTVSSGRTFASCGYDVVAIYHEGSDIAQAFVERGISAAVLKYRVPDIRTATKPEKAPFADFHRAMELLRAEQEKAKIRDGTSQWPDLAVNWVKRLYE